MWKSIILLGWYLAVVSGVFTPAIAADLNLAVVIRDLARNAPVEKVRIVMETEEGPKDLSEKRPGYYEFTGSLGSSPRTVVLSVTPPTQFADREVPVRLRTSGARPRWNLKMFVVEKSTEVNHDYLGRGVAHFRTGDYEKAWAHYDYGFAMEGGYQPIDDFYVKLNFNYARALHNVCVGLPYDTCDRAAKVAKSMLDIYDTKEKVFARNGVERAQLEQIIRDRNIRLLRARYYQEVRSPFTAGSYVDAAKAAEALLGEAKQQPQIFADARITVDLLSDAAGVAYLKAVEEAEKTGEVDIAEVTERLRAANGLLSQVQARDKYKVAENLRVIELKLNAYGQ